MSVVLALKGSRRAFEQITELVDVECRFSIALEELFLGTDSGQYTKSASKLTLQTKADIGVGSVHGVSGM
jgi:hypothetical protein